MRYVWVSSDRDKQPCISHHTSYEQYLNVSKLLFAMLYWHLQQNITYTLLHTPTSTRPPRRVNVTTLSFKTTSIHKWMNTALYFQASLFDRKKHGFFPYFTFVLSTPRFKFTPKTLATNFQPKSVENLLLAFVANTKNCNAINQAFFNITFGLRVSVPWVFGRNLEFF